MILPTGLPVLPTGKTPLRAPSRRRAMGLFGAGLVAPLLPAPPARAHGWPMRSGVRGIDQRHLWVCQAGRDEALHCAFRTGDGAPETLWVNTLSWLFRDWRDHDQGLLIDIRLFDLLATVQTVLTIVAARPLEIVLDSGYRTPERNRTIEGAAVNSQHIHGRAADIVIHGIPPVRVADAAEIAGAPGLGRYPDFTHVDVGPSGRRWTG